MHQIKDPCKDCLVKACCSKPCDEKYEYATDCISDLTEFYKKYKIYQGGRKKADTLLSNEVLKEKRNLVDICVKNNDDINIYITRGIYEKSVR